MTWSTVPTSRTYSWKDENIDPLVNIPRMASVMRAFDYSYIEHRYGWPLRSFKVQAILFWWPPDEPWWTSDPGQSEHAMLIRGEWPNDADDYATSAFDDWPPWIPLLPCWIGLVGDTATYGAVLFCLINGLLYLSRRIRQARGLCPTCAYDLRGQIDTGCPECGWGRD
ncbi:MAG: hypothetical protein D8M59_10065 [Planctomycetes bacterium]|nr:hypothetical protein [Planctomycetota bacterium]